jgi:Arc/MetJ-type ribon-helix-helix transcriptional regulator
MELSIGFESATARAFPYRLAYDERGAEAMEVQLTTDQKALARRAVETGRLHSEEEAVQEALALWEDRERRRIAFFATLDESRASLAQGEGRIITEESMRELAAEVRERGRARLIAELANAH